MSDTNWEALTERYYAGETTVEEERLLRQYWRESRNAPEASLADFFDREADKQLSPEATNRIRLRISAVGARRRILFRWASAAAVLGLIFSLWFLSPDRMMPAGSGDFPLAEVSGATDWSQYEVTDPEQAAAIVMGSLKTVASGIQAGRQSLEGIKEMSRLSNPMNDK